VRLLCVPRGNHSSLTYFLPILRYNYFSA